MNKIAYGLNEDTKFKVKPPGLAGEDGNCHNPVE